MIIPSLPDEAPDLHLLSDDEFEELYPSDIQGLSRRQWTPVDVCCRAAHWLAPHPDYRVLDVGCGPGKFCAIGASATGAYFTGVEQRERLVRIGRHMLRRCKLPRVQLLHANALDVPFTDYDSIYLFNPFQENLLDEALRIDFDVPLVPQLYQDYNAYVRAQLGLMPPGTRVVTYWGHTEEIPSGYTLQASAYDGWLRLWVKGDP